MNSINEIISREQNQQLKYYFQYYLYFSNIILYKMEQNY